VEVAVANCAENGVSGKVSLEVGGLTAEHTGRYDIAVANISTQANLPLAAAFAAVVNPGGRLLLSGSLAEDAGRLRAAMAAEGLEERAFEQEGDWCLLDFERT
jgi:ribosomal protein L11 methyltransferase